jgi:basic amino acid/polyamine antiporter, APA family
MGTIPKPVPNRTADRRAGAADAPVFARKSSGLVRAASTTDASLVNLYVATFPIMVSFLLGIVLPFYAGANLYLAILIGAALAMPILLTYAVASSVMRRSGGDYVFIGRLLHPALGFAANFAFVAFQTVFLTSSGYFFCLWCLSPLARLLGVELDSSALITFADTLVKPFSIFVVSEIFVVGFGLLFMFKSTRSILRIFRITMPISAIGLLAFVVALLVHSKSALHANFDGYVHHATGVSHATAAAEASAKSNGFSLPPFSLAATLLAVTWPSFSLPYYLGSAYFAGEVRNARRGQLLAGPATAIVAVIGCLILVWVSLGRLGPEFLGSLAAADPAKLGMSGAPTYMEVAAGSSGNVVLGALILLGFGSWLVPTVPMSLLIMTRCMFGWSMDRIAPDALSKVSARTNSPYVAVAVVTVISAVISYFWAYTDFFTVVVGAFAQVITLGIGCLAASLIPLKRRDLYETSPIRGRWGAIPKLTAIGVLGAIAAALIAINFARDSSSGVNPAAATVMFWVSLGMFALGFALYYLSAAIRRRQGVDIALAFKEIPPE